MYSLKRLGLVSTRKRNVKFKKKVNKNDPEVFEARATSGLSRVTAVLR